jgi:hypothetical protein
MNNSIHLEGTYADFINTLSRGNHDLATLHEASDGLRDRIAEIDRQLASKGRDEVWANSAETARKYYARKFDAVNAAIAARFSPSSLTPARRPSPEAESTASMVGLRKRPAPPPHGVLATFSQNGDLIPIATRQNIADLCVDLMLDATRVKEAPPLLVAYINLTEAAAESLPAEVWYESHTESDED